VDPFVLELDFGPFNARFPRLKIPKSIGNGVQFLNRHLSSHLFNNPESMVPMFEFLRTHRYRGEVKISAFFILVLHPPALAQLFIRQISYQRNKLMFLLIGI
jgi:hypothetical protein